MPFRKLKMCRNAGKRDRLVIEMALQIAFNLSAVAARLLVSRIRRHTQLPLAKLAAAVAKMFGKQLKRRLWRFDAADELAVDRIILRAQMKRFSQPDQSAHQAEAHAFDDVLRQAVHAHLMHDGLHSLGCAGSVRAHQPGMKLLLLPSRIPSLAQISIRLHVAKKPFSSVEIIA